jgi:uncharacterized RDD family membrane protein YckC
LATASTARAGTVQGGSLIDVTFRGTERYVEASGVAALVVFFLALVVVVFAVVPAIAGGTAGMKIVGLGVVRDDGTRASLPRHLARTALWVVDAFPYLIPAVAFLCAAPTRGHRRVGDLVARTSVVRAARPQHGVAAIIVAAGLACVAADAAFIASSSFHQTPRHLAEEYGMQGNAFPLAMIRTHDGTFSFVVGRPPGRVAPCMNFIVPGMGGGVCFVFVSAKCGWTLEAYTASAGRDAVAYGAAVPSAATVRFGQAGSITAGLVVDVCAGPGVDV